MLLDLDGKEVIIVTGGNYNHAEYNQNKGYKYNFVEPSIREIKEITINNPDENITWVIADQGYNLIDKIAMNSVANAYDVDIMYITETEQLIDYVNNKTEREFLGLNIGQKRQDDKITGMSFYSHGMPSGTIDLAYKYTEDLKIEKEMITQFETEAFENPYTFFGCCNTGTDQAEQVESFAQLWVNHTGGKARAANGKTDYSDINVGEKNWKYYIGALDRELGLFNSYGSLNGPTTSEDVSWIDFLPSCE